MASPGLDLADSPPSLGESPPEAAFSEAQKWIQQVTGRSFGEKDFRSGLENGILLCELLNAIRPGLVKKINRLPTPIAGLDNLVVFLRGCKELGLKESQLFDPGDLQDTSNRAAVKSTECSRKLKNVLVTIYWLGKAANSCTSYSGATLDLKEFEGLLAQMRKESDDVDSPKRSIRDSGYIDCWDSERSDSLSPPRHGRDDSFDSLDSFGSRSQQTPSPDVILRGSSDGRGSDSESDFPHRKIPDVKKDDMSARRVSYGDSKAFVPFNQYLPNKSNQTAYIPAPLRKKKAEREEYRKSWSTATSPLGGERTFSQSHPGPKKEEKPELMQLNGDQPVGEDSRAGPGGQLTSPCTDLNRNQDDIVRDQSLTRGRKERITVDKQAAGDAKNLRKLKKLERDGIKIMTAMKRYSSQSHPELIEEESQVFHCEAGRPIEEDSEEGHGGKSTNLQEDLSRNQDDIRDQALTGGKKERSSADKRDSNDAEEVQKMKRLERIGIRVMPAAKRYSSQHQTTEDHESMPEIILRKENTFITASQGKDSDSEEEHEECRVPDITKDDLATRRIRINQTKTSAPVNQFPLGMHAIQKRSKRDDVQLPPPGLTEKTPVLTSDKPGRLEEGKKIVTRKENPFLALEDESEEEEEEEKIPDIQRDDLAKRKAQGSSSQPRESKSFVKASITKADLETWERLKVSAETSDDESKLPLLVCKSEPKAAKEESITGQDDLACRKVRESRKRPHTRQRFVHFGPVTEIVQQKWEKLSIAKPESVDEVALESSSSQASTATVPPLPVDASNIHDTEGKEKVLQCDSSLVTRQTTKDSITENSSSSVSEKQTVSILRGQREVSKESVHLPDPSRDDTSKRRLGAFRKMPNAVGTPVFSASVAHHQLQQKKFPQICIATHFEDESSSVPLPGTAAGNSITPTASSVSSAVLKEESAPVLNVQGPSTEAEDEMRVPDPEKDDMMTRRTGVFPKLSGPGLKHFLPVPFTKQKEDSAMVSTKADKQVRSKSPSYMLTERKRALSPLRAESLEKATMQPQLKQDGEDAHPHKGQEDQPVLPAIVPPQPQPAINYIHTGPTCKATPDTAQSDVSRFSSRAALSDDAESMSMFDMRCDDGIVTQPHSRVHQENLQNVNNLLKEEDDQWQDDLARWKNRRRSASHDLIKKEQERKKMEKVLSGEDALNERRKSIKTYKEIVEEKERREKELHEAYKNAKSQEEAEKILQKYIERFTISEAVLERLQMPKILERSQSVQPNLLSPPEDPNPMKYLRQQSAPLSSPKFTSTVEATISPTSEAADRLSPGRTSPNKAVVSKAMPLLVPKPYSQPKSTQVLRTFKVDGKVSMNGESFNGIEDENEDKDSAMVFEASPDRDEEFDGASRVDGSAEELKQESTRIELNLQRPVSRSICNTLMASSTEETKYVNCREENNLGGCTEETRSACVTTGPIQSQQIAAVFSVTSVTSLEGATPNHREETVVVESNENCLEKGASRDTVLKQKAVKSEDKELDEYAVFEFVKKMPEVTHAPCQNATQQVESNSCEMSPVLTPSLNSSKHVNWSWDPEEERKRQERWQQEQERLLQERYRKEQEKLKDEWDKAQKEVEEEERKYYEEERKIIEDTLVPFAVSSSSAEPFSSCSSSVTEDNRTSEPLVRSMPEVKANHLVSENQTCAAWKTCDEVEEKALRTDGEKHKPLWGQEGESQPGSGRVEHRQEETRKEMSAGCQETTTLTRSEQASQALTEARSSPTRMQLQLQDPPGMLQSLHKESPASEELQLQAPLLNQSSSLQVHTSGRIRRSGSHENVKSGLSSPCSPTPQCHSPSRSISGKKLCSTCGLPLGKGAAMIIETLSLFFHIQCFQCGICKGQLGDTTSGTDVRIRNGLLNCNDCYIRSRTAGQPTTL